MSVCDNCKTREGRGYTYYIGSQRTAGNKIVYNSGSPHTFYLCDECINKNIEFGNKLGFVISIIVIAISILLFALMKDIMRPFILGVPGFIFLIPGVIALIFLTVSLIKGLVRVLKYRKSFFSRVILDKTTKGLAMNVWTGGQGAVTNFRTEEEVRKMFYR